MNNYKQVFPLFIEFFNILDGVPYSFIPIQS